MISSVAHHYVVRGISFTWNSRLTSTSSCSSGDLATGSMRHEQKDLQQRVQKHIEMPGKKTIFEFTGHEK